MKTALILAAVLLGGLGFMLFLQRQQMARMRAENAALREQARELAALQEEQRRRAQSPGAEANLAREQQAELLRLRGEVTRLRNEARQSAAGRPEATPPPAVAPQVSSQSEAYSAPFTAAARVSVRSGETFATGGWSASQGSRAIFLATPTLGEATEKGKTINIGMCVLNVADGELPQTLLQRLDGQAQGQAPVLTGSELAFLVDQLSSGGGTNIISRPRIVTSDGTPASMFVGESRPNRDGTYRQVGTRIDLSPQVAQDGQTIQLEVKVEYTPPVEQ